MKTTQTQIQYLTQLRALACIAIVVLHTFYAASVYAPSFTEKTTALTIRNLMMWAVPCFVMVSGALLLDKARNVTYSKLFRKYIPRMILTLVSFSLLFVILDTLVAGETIGVSTLLTALHNIAFGKSWSHLWYLYLMIGLYLLLPLYRKITANLDKKDALYLVGVYLVFLSILPMINTITATKSAFYICVYSVYPLFLFLGFAISQGLLPCKRWVWITLAVSGTVLIAVSSVLSEKFQLESLSDLLENYAFPVIVLQAAGFFGMMHAKQQKTPKWIHFLLTQIDNCSFGIYLLHMVLLKTVLVYVGWNPYLYGGTAMVFLLAIVTTICTFGVVWALKKVPVLKQFL